MASPVWHNHSFNEKRQFFTLWQIYTSHHFAIKVHKHYFTLDFIINICFHDSYIIISSSWIRNLYDYNYAITYWTIQRLQIFNVLGDKPFFTCTYGEVVNRLCSCTWGVKIVTCFLVSCDSYKNVCKSEPLLFQILWYVPDFVFICGTSWSLEPSLCYITSRMFLFGM